MKKIILAGALVALSTPVIAGGLEPVQPEPTVPYVAPVQVVQETKPSGAAGLLVPVMTLLMIAGAAAS